MNHDSQIFILCEDRTHYHFAKKYFELLGFNGRKIRGSHNPKGRSVGSGAVFVKEHYEKELKAFRSKVTHLDCVLVIIIDDDTKNHVQHLYNFYQPLINEKILIFSPKRNIESWFHYIDGNSIDESEDYKKYHKNAKLTEYAKKLKNEICINGLPSNAPSSLHHACGELNRL
jgi:hypothetical protein